MLMRGRAWGAGCIGSSTAVLFTANGRFPGKVHQRHISDPLSPLQELFSVLRLAVPTAGCFPTRVTGHKSFAPLRAARVH